MNYIIKIPIGDWSKDGHNQYEVVVINSNYPVKTLQDAYKASCKLTGVQFNHNENYTGIEGLDYDERKEIQVCTDYEDNEIPYILYEVMQQYGIEDLEWYKDNMCFDGVDHFVEVLLWFIGLSAPDDWEYSIKEEEGEYLNGFWNDELNVQFGYGLFN